MQLDVGVVEYVLEFVMVDDFDGVEPSSIRMYSARFICVDFFI
jgi:hypothetical protein